MLHLLSSGIVSLGLHAVGVEVKPVETLALLSGLPGLVLSGQPDSSTEAALQQYLQQLEIQGMVASDQGIWIQAGVWQLASHQGTIPRSAASITKVATSLAALNTWSPQHQFETAIGARGRVQNGEIQGDLVITGGSDPLFVWQEAIALGNALNQVGIRRVSGDLVIEGDFALNFESDPQQAGLLLREAFNSALWSEEVQANYEKLPPGTPKPEVEIAGVVGTLPNPQDKSLAVTPLIQHQSLPLISLLKEMNVHSNNEMAETIARAAGGASAVSRKAAKAAGVPLQEIQLINGSGLGQENRISPRAACAMFAAIQRQLQPYALNVGDVFPVARRDLGTLEDRQVPRASAVKTGTLWNVSALAGVMPTQDRGLIWFAILNGGGDYIEGFREGQDRFLQDLQKQWGDLGTSSAAITPTTQAKDHRLGDERRNQRRFGAESLASGTVEE